MAYLLRTEDEYRLCYGEPVYGYIASFGGMLFGADEYQKMCDEEKEVECNALLESHNILINEWADTGMNNSGVSVSDDIAEYILQGDSLSVNSFIEVVTITLESPQSIS